MNDQARVRGDLSSGRPKREEWKKKNNRQLRTVRGAIVGLGGMALVLGLLLLILPMFKIREIEVVGNELVSTESILAAANVKVGDEVVGLDLAAIVDRIQNNCHISVKATLTPSKLKIEVKKELAELYISYADKWFSLDRDLNVLDVSDSEADFEGLLKAELPAIAGITVGQKLLFCDAETDRAYITEMLELFEALELTDRVDLLDVSEKFNVSYVIDGSIRMVVGKVSDLAVKLELADQILRSKEGADAYAIVDVSDLKRSTYRPMASSEMLLAG